MATGGRGGGERVGRDDREEERAAYLEAGVEIVPGTGVAIVHRSVGRSVGDGRVARRGCGDAGCRCRHRPWQHDREGGRRRCRRVGGGVCQRPLWVFDVESASPLDGGEGVAPLVPTTHIGAGTRIRVATAAASTATDAGRLPAARDGIPSAVPPASVLSMRERPPASPAAATSIRPGQHPRGGAHRLRHRGGAARAADATALHGQRQGGAGASCTAPRQRRTAASPTCVGTPPHHRGGEGGRGDQTAPSAATADPPPDEASVRDCGRRVHRRGLQAYPI